MDSEVTEEESKVISDAEFSELMKIMWSPYKYTEIYMSDFKDKLSAEELALWESIQRKQSECNRAEDEEYDAQREAQIAGIEREEVEIPPPQYTEAEQEVLSKPYNHFKEVYESPCSPKEKKARDRHLDPFKFKYTFWRSNSPFMWLPQDSAQKKSPKGSL